MDGNREESDVEIQIVDDTAPCRRDSSSPTVSTSVCARPWWCVADAFCCRQLCLCVTPKTKRKKKKKKKKKRRRRRRRTTTRCVACSNAGATGKTKSSYYLFIYLFWEQGGGGDTQRQGTTVLLFREIWIVEQ